MKRVGMIGLGNMGRPMALNLLRKGFEVQVYDISSASVEMLASEGAIRAASPRAAALACEALVLSLPNENVLENVMLGEDGIASAELPGTVVIDTTTSTYSAAVKLAEAVRQVGGEFLDSPVTGGVGGAEQGTLSMMIGGDESAFMKHRDVFEALGSNIVYVGASGHGQVSKMVNQLLMGAIYCSVAEGFGFAAQLGVDVEKVYQAVEQGGARSAVLSGMKKLILSGEYGGGSYLAQHGKDIDYVMKEANQWHSYMPITSAVHEVWNLARLKGYGKLNSQSMFAVWEDLLGKKLNETIASSPKEG